MIVLNFRDQLIDDLIHSTAVFGGARDNQRRARLVDKNGINFVHDREIMVALVHLGQLRLHVVAQVIKTQFVVGRVGHITAVRRVLFLFRLLRVHNACCKPKKTEDLAHPFGVTFREVIVHRHNMHTFTRQRVQIRRESRDKGLTLTCFHLRYITFVQKYPAHKLHIKRPQTKGTLGGFATVCKRLWQKIIKAFTAHRALGQFFGFLLDTFIRQRLKFGFKRIDRFNDGARGLYLTIIRSTEYLLRNGTKTEHILSARAAIGVSDINVCRRLVVPFGRAQ